MMKNVIVFFMVFCAWKANAQCIVSEPASTFRCQGSASNATFTLSAPTATAYDWQQLNSATSTWSSLVNGANYAGVATNAMTVSGLNTTPASFSFRCIVTNGATACDTSVTVILTIRPKPVLTISGNNSVCSGTSNNISLTLSNSLGAAGSSYSWSRASVTGITPSTSTGTASSISETLVSTNSSGTIVNYNVTTTTNACASDPIQFQVTVKPKPVLTITGSNSVCSGTTNNIGLTLSNNLGSGTYNWNRASVSGISPSISSGTSSSITESLVSTNTSGTMVTYNATTTTNGCSSDTGSLQVTVKPKPVLTITGSNNVCSGTTNNIGLTLSSNLGSATYNWSRSSVSGISPSISTGTSSSITESLVSTNTSGTMVTYNATTTTNGCSSDTGSLQVSVKPKPTLTNSGSISVCSGTANNVNLTLNSNLGSATYSWSRLTVSGITPSTNSGSSSSISETLINSSSSQIPVGYTAFTTTNGCTSDQLSITITVKPKPSIASTPVTICSSNGVLVTPTDGVGGDIVPSNTVYSWAAPSNANLTGITSGSGSNNFNQLLTNISGGNQSLIYTVTPTAGTCTGASFSINVTVKNEPTPQIIAAQSICPGESVQLFVNGGANYNWTPNTNINATFINNPTVSPTATTTYTAQVTGDNGCSVSPTVTVTVQSLPTITNIASAGTTVCSGGSYNFTPSVASGTTYQWTRNNNGAYSADASIGTSAITNVLLNDLSAATAVTYNFSLTNSGGCTNSQSINVVVNPLPQITNQLDVPNSICSNEAFSFSPVSLPASSFSWTRVLPASVSLSNPSASSGTSAISNHTFINNSNSPQWVEYNFTLMSSSGSCTASQTLGFWVQPSISLSSSTVAVCSGSELNYFPQLANNLNDVTVFWTRNAFSTGLSSTGSIQGQGMINQVISNSSNGALTATYNLTGYYNGCSSNAATLNVTVNPIPVITKSNVVQSTCSNSSWTTNLNSSLTVGTNSFSWTSIPNPILSLQTGSLSGSNSTITQSWINGNSDILEVAYTAQVTNNGCTSSPLTWTIEVKPIPVLTNLPVGSAICSGESFVFVPSWTIPGTSYNWNRTTPNQASGTTPINEVLSNASNNVVNANYSILGSALGCSSLNNTFSVAINPLPITASINQSTFCNGEEVNISLNGWNGYDVSWYPANLFSDFQSANTTYIGSESSVVSAQAQNSFGCTIEQLFPITIGDPLDASFTWEGGICQGNEIIVNANNPNYDVYTWILNGIDISDAGSTSFNLGASDEIELAVQDENGCLAATSQIIVGVANPQNQIFGSDILCQNQTNVTFNALAIEGNLHWSVINGTLQGGQGYPEAVFDFGQGDQAFVYLESTNNEGCSSTDTLVISLTGQADSSFSIYLLGISTLVHPDSTFEIYRWGKTGIVSGIEESWTTDFQYYNYSLVDVTQNYYWVETTNAEGCTTRSYYNEPVVPNGVVNKADVSIKFYPNPTNDGILFFNGNQNLEFALFDSMGQLVFNGSSDGVIDLSMENSGLYYIVYQEQGISRTQKLIKL